MSPIAISLIITGIVIVLYVTQIIPLPVTSMLGALAMAFTGVISFEDSIKAFGSDALLLVVGAIIMGNALTECGVTQIIGRAILKNKRIAQSERLFIVVIVILTAFLSAFLSNTACVAMFMPMVAAVAAESKGTITKKNSFMAIGIASVAGGVCTLVGSTPQLIANGVLEQTEGCTPMGFFDLAKGGILTVALIVLYYATFGYNIQKKVFNFDDPVDEHFENHDTSDIPKWKPIVSSAIFITCIICFVAGIGTVGTVALVGGALCIATKCISEKKAFATMDWRSVTVMGGALGIAKGLNESGAIEMIANETLKIFGGENASPYMICIALFILGAILGNIVSHAATAAILAPLGISLALALNSNPITFVIVIVIGINTTFMTPISTPPMTMTLAGGYRFMDYVKVGGILNVFVALIGALTIPLIYGL